VKCYILDANVVVRFFTQDPPAMGRAATELLEAAATGAAELWWVPAIVAEVVFVLSKVYGRPRLAVADALLELIENPGISVEGVINRSPSILQMPCWLQSQPNGKCQSPPSTRIWISSEM
jgi:predicted nucleic-acid-binding protein